MNAAMNMFRRAYGYTALLALLHVIAATAVVSYLVGTGGLTMEKARELVRVMRGDAVAIQSQPVAPHGDQPPTADTSAADAPLSFAQQQTALEMMRLESERIKTELDQRLALNNSIMLRVTAEREAFQRDQKTAVDAQSQSAALREREGFQKQLAIFENLAPKVAIEHLLQMENDDDAARILMEMDTRKAKKIVEAAKRGKQMDTMRAILQRIRELAPVRSAEIASNQ